MISGNGTLTMAGSSTLTLGGNNTYTGDTVVSGGTLLLGTPLALQDSRLNYNGQGGVLSFGSQTSTTFGSLTGSQNLDLDNTMPAAVTLSVGNNNGSDTYSGVLSGSGSLTKVGSGTFTLAGSNTYTGGTTLAAGILNLGVGQNGSTSGPLGSPVSIAFAGGTLQYSSVNQYDYSSSFSTAGNQAYSVDTNGQSVTWATGLVSSGGSLTKIGSGTLTLSGSNFYSGTTTIAAGTLAFNASSNQTLSGAISGSGSLAQLGPGQLTLSGNSSFTGNVTISGGTLVAGGPSQYNVQGRP